MVWNDKEKKNVGPPLEVPLSDGPGSENAKREITLSSLGPLKDAEKRDLNCAVKEYLLFGGYRLTAMTFIEEVICLYSLFPSLST